MKPTGSEHEVYEYVEVSIAADHHVLTKHHVQNPGREKSYQGMRLPYGCCGKEKQEIVVLETLWRLSQGV